MIKDDRSLELWRLSKEVEHSQIRLLEAFSFPSQPVVQYSHVITTWSYRQQYLLTLVWLLQLTPLSLWIKCSINFCNRFINFCNCFLSCGKCSNFDIITLNFGNYPSNIFHNCFFHKHNITKHIHKLRNIPDLHTQSFHDCVKAVDLRTRDFCQNDAIHDFTHTLCSSRKMRHAFSIGAWTFPMPQGKMSHNRQVVWPQSEVSVCIRKMSERLTGMVPLANIE